MKYKDIIEKYNITHSELRSIIRKNKLTRTKSKAQIGNKNAVGNKGGHGTENNKNAVTTGEYESIYQDVLEEDEINLYKSLAVDDKEQLLINDYKILTIREKRMLMRIQRLKQQGKDMTIDFIRKKNTRTGKITEETETITEAEPTINMIQRIEDGLTRVQEAKRKTLESLAKLNNNEDDKTLNVNLLGGSNPLLESINRQLGGNNNE
nr:MAG TPA: Small Terminase [Caudoviricetes sp.]